MAAITDRLSTIVAGADYWSTLAIPPTRSLLWIDQYKTFPVLGVMRSSGSVLTQIAQPNRYEDRVHIALWGYVLGDAAVIAGTRLERLWADHVKCLLADSTLGGLVLDLRPEGPMDTDDGVLEPFALFAQDWAVMLHQTIG